MEEEDAMKYAVCNEIFKNKKWEEVCRFVKAAGFDGIEIAPMTFAESVRDIPPSRRAEIRKLAADNGLELPALHKLMSSPKGLSINSPDPAVRQAGVDYLIALFEFAADLGCRLLIYGSPASRNVQGSLTYNQARDNMKDSLLKCLDNAKKAGLLLCLEPLSAEVTNIFATVEAAYGFVCNVSHPSFVLMADCKAMASEKRPIPDTIRLFGSEIQHLHGNDALGVAPGFGIVDFAPILQALKEIGYQGYFSLEPFSCRPDAETVASVSLKYLKSLL